MSNNPNFFANMSSDEIYFGQDSTLCITDVVNGKADINHTHTGYATTKHTHSDYALASNLESLEDIVTDKAAVDHAHNEYALSNHDHSDYAAVTTVNALIETVNSKVDATHCHDELYASISHNHNGEYASISHNHDNEYATIASYDHLDTELSNKSDMGHEHGEYVIALNEMSAIISSKANTSHSHDDVYYTETEMDTKLANKADSSHTHTNYADISHKHYAQEVLVAGEDLNNYTDAGIYVFAQAYAPINVPAGTNGWLVVIPWGDGSGTVKQLWFRHGTSGTNDHETYVRTKVANVTSWSNWSKYYTTSNPPTYAEVGASPAFTSSNGGVEYSYNADSGKNVLDEINVMPQGLHTIYAQGGVTGNPKSSESWRMLVHKTSSAIGWIVAFGSSGSIYANYQNAASSFTGWSCVYEATNKMVLWSGASYLTSTNGVPQVVTPSKKLSDCRTGWLLLWSDYDASTSTANDNDFCTTFIPKYTPSGDTWSGKAFLCSLPTYVGSDASNLSTQITVIKPVYVHDDCLKGSYQNTSGGRNDVVLRAVYEV